MIVTTTNSIEGREISRYDDPRAANVVIGTNIFSDIGAGYEGSLTILQTKRINYFMASSNLMTIPEQLNYSIVICWRGESP